MWKGVVGHTKRKAIKSIIGSPDPGIFLQLYRSQVPDMTIAPVGNINVKQNDHSRFHIAPSRHQKDSYAMLLIVYFRTVGESSNLSPRSYSRCNTTIIGRVKSCMRQEDLE